MNSSRLLYDFLGLDQISFYDMLRLLGIRSGVPTLPTQLIRGFFFGKFPGHAFVWFLFQFVCLLVLIMPTIL